MKALTDKHEKTKKTLSISDIGNRIAISADEIERINGLHVGIKRAARKILKDAIEIGESFLVWHKEICRAGDRKSGWGKWIGDYFPQMTISTIYRYMDFARNKDYLKTLPVSPDDLTLEEADRWIRAKDRKPRVRTVVVNKDADPLIVLEAKLKNFVIVTWQLRYLQTEISGMLETLDLRPDQLLRVLHHVCKEHQEVEDEVMRTFNPQLKIVKIVTENT